jgi:hypothetical protein
VSVHLKLDLYLLLKSSFQTVTSTLFFLSEKISLITPIQREVVLKKSISISTFHFTQTPRSVFPRIISLLSHLYKTIGQNIKKFVTKVHLGILIWRCCYRWRAGTLTNDSIQYWSWIRHRFWYCAYVVESNRKAGKLFYSMSLFVIRVTGCKQSLRSFCRHHNISFYSQRMSLFQNTCWKNQTLEVINPCFKCMIFLRVWWIQERRSQIQSQYTVWLLQTS